MSELMTWITTEYAREGSVFGVHRPYKAGEKKLPIFGGETIETPFGPAAGPNTQLAQNIIASYFGGARFFELKTVQKMDGAELSACVNRPCILAEDECYNCEWSTELYVPQAYEEYVKAWCACKILAKVYGLGDPNGDNTSNVNGWRNCLSSIYGYFAWQLDVGTNYNSTSVASDVATWSDLYARINYVNVILDEITQLPHETEDDQAAYLRVQGEAHFLRGWFYFVLANLYGDAYAPATAAQKLCVPLKLTPYVEHDKDKPTQFQRATVKEVYDQIVADLLIAEDYLTQSPQKADHRLYRASLDAVELLLSRVYLYMQDYAQAELKAEAVMESDYVRLAPLSALSSTAPFLTNTNPELIFSQGSNNLAPTGIFTGMAGDFCVTRELRDLYDENDRRGNCFFGISSNDSISLAYKYQRGTLRSRVSDVFTLRMAEAYLNKAEACAMSGKDAEALEALNALRANRIDGYADVSCSGEELVNEIRTERRKELCFEGHRWFDLRRYAVCEKYPYKRSILHVFNAIGDNTPYLYTEYFRLLPDDPAYTFSLPTSVLEFDKVPMENNPREDRPPLDGSSTPTE